MKPLVQLPPQDWLLCRLEDIATVERGKFSARPRNDPKYYGGDFPFIQTGDVSRSSGIITSYSQTLNKSGLNVSRLFPRGTIVVTIAANIGEVAISEFDFSCPDSIVGVTPRNGVDRRWLLYFLQTTKEYLESNATQNAQKNINLQVLRPMVVLVPPLPEQTIIAAILSSVDDAIQATQRVIDQTRVVKKGLLQELLTSGIGHTKFKMTEIGEVPESWDVSTLGSICSFQPGYAFKSMDFSTQGDRLLRGSNIGVGSVSWAADKTEYFPSERRDEFADYVLNEGDIVVAMDRPFISGGFKIAKISRSDLPVLLLQRVGRVRPVESTPDFAWVLLQSAFVKGHLLTSQKGTDLPHISKRDIESCVVPVPPIPEQMQIASAICTIESCLAFDENHLLAMQKLKQGLLQDLLTGKVRVNVN